MDVFEKAVDERGRGTMREAADPDGLARPDELAERRLADRAAYWRRRCERELAREAKLAVYRAPSGDGGAGARARASPSPDALELARVPEGVEVVVERESGGWGRLSLCGRWWRGEATRRAVARARGGRFGRA